MTDLLSRLRRGVGGAPGGVKLPPVPSMCKSRSRNTPVERFFTGQRALPRLPKNLADEASEAGSQRCSPSPVSFGNSAYFQPPPTPITHKIAQTGAAVLPGGKPDALPDLSSTLRSACGMSDTQRSVPVYPFCVIPGRAQVRAKSKQKSAQWMNSDSFMQQPGLAVDEGDAWVRDELDQFDDRLETLAPLGSGRCSSFPPVTAPPRLADVLFLIMLLRDAKMVKTLHRKGHAELASKWKAQNVDTTQKVPKNIYHRIMRAICKGAYDEMTAERLYSLFGIPSTPHPGASLLDVQLGVDIIMSKSDPEEALQFFFALTGGLENSNNMCDYITRFEIDVLNRAYTNSIPQPRTSADPPTPDTQDPEEALPLSSCQSGMGSTPVPAPLPKSPLEAVSSKVMAINAWSQDPLAGSQEPEESKEPPAVVQSPGAPRDSVDKKPAFLVPPSEGPTGPVGPSADRLHAIAESLEYDSLGRVPLKSFTAAFVSGLHDVFPQHPLLRSPSSPRSPRRERKASFVDSKRSSQSDSSSRESTNIQLLDAQY